MATSEYWRRGCQGSKGSRGLTAAGGRGGRGWGEQQRPRRLRQGQLGPESPSLLEVPGAPDSGTLGRPSRRWGKAPAGTGGDICTLTREPQTASQAPRGGQEVGTVPSRETEQPLNALGPDTWGSSVGSSRKQGQPSRGALRLGCGPGVQLSHQPRAACTGPVRRPRLRKGAMVRAGTG